MKKNCVFQLLWTSSLIELRNKIWILREPLNVWCDVDSISKFDGCYEWNGMYVYMHDAFLFAFANGEVLLYLCCAFLHCYR